MKKLKLFSLVVLATISFSSCNFQYKNDVLSGLETKASGLSYDECGLYINDKKLTTNDVPLGDDVVCAFSGVDGFVQENGMCFIGASMIVTNEKGEEMLNEPDLFADYDEEGITPEDSKNLSMTLMTGSPMAAGEKYIWKMRFWDKKGKGEITASATVTLK